MIKYYFSTLIVALFTQNIASSAIYIPPKNEPVLDTGKLTIDVDQLSELSQNLSQLATHKHDNQKADLIRNNAKLIYLALMLNPDNKFANDLNKAYIANKPIGSIKKEALSNTALKIKKYIDYFSRNESNKSEKQLSLLIKDCLISIFPNVKELKDHKVSENRWKNQIAKLEDFNIDNSISKLSSNKKVPPTIIPKFHKKLLDHKQDNQLFFAPLFAKEYNFHGHDGKANINVQNVDWVQNGLLQHATFKENSYIQYSHIVDMERTEKFTLHTWVKPNTEVQGSIISNINSEGRGWSLGIKNNRPILLLNHEIGSNTLKIRSSEKILSEQWSLITITYDGTSKASGVSIYINGKSAETKIINDTLTNTILTQEPFIIGQQPDGSLDLKETSIAFISINKGIRNSEQILKRYQRFISSKDNIIISSLPKTIEPEKLNTELKFFDSTNMLNDQNNIAPTYQENIAYEKYQGTYALKINNGGYVHYTPGHGEFKNDDSFTASVWFHTKSENNGALIAKMNESNAFRGWDILLEKNKVVLHLIHHWPDNAIKITTDVTVPQNRWTNVVVTHDGSQKANGIMVYIDGKPVSYTIQNDSLSNSISNKVPLMIGRRSNGGFPLSDIAVSHVKITNNVDTPENIENSTSKRLLELNPNLTLEQINQVIGNINIPKGPLKLHIKNSIIHSPIIHLEQINGIWISKVILAKINISENGVGFNYEPLQIVLKPIDHEHSHTGFTKQWIDESLSKLYGTLNGLKVGVHTEKFYKPQNNQSISGPIAIGIGASLMKKKIPDNTVVCASVYADGKLIRPTSLWDQLPGLVNSEQMHRVIIGENAKDDFKQLIVHKNVGFFILNEVIEVSTLHDGVEAATLSHPDIEKASALFKELQAEYDDDDIARMAFDLDVRDRLEEIIKIYPNHISAQMILLWGTDDRPESYNSMFSYLILNKVLTSFEWMKDIQYHETNSDYVYVIADKAKEDLEKLEEYINDDDENIFNEIEDCIPLMESVARNKIERPRTAETNLNKLKEKIKKNREEISLYFKEVSEKSKK